MRFLSEEWAERVRAEVDRGPGAEVMAAKLPTYWEWIDRVRADYKSSWALGVRERSTYLVLTWKDGACVRAEVTPDPGEADYVLQADVATWRDLLTGEDPGRIVMYRRMRLERGEILRFFRGIYFFVEVVAAIGRVPAELP